MNRPDLTLTLSEASHTALVKTANNTRGGIAKVDRKALFALLRDHSAALGMLNEIGVKTR